jgi:hypothetical protein
VARCNRLSACSRMVEVGAVDAAARDRSRQESRDDSKGKTGAKAHHRGGHVIARICR